jgi:hypothetical protein
MKKKTYSKILTVHGTCADLLPQEFYTAEHTVPYTTVHGNIRPQTIVVLFRIRRTELYLSKFSTFFTASVYGIRLSSFFSVYAHRTRRSCTICVYLRKRSFTSVPLRPGYHCHYRTSL